MNLGKRIRHMRQARGLTAVELAKRARVTTGFISQLEHSHTVPSLQTLQRIATALGISLTYFLLDESPQPQVVGLTSNQTDEYIFPALKAGAISYVLKDIPMDELAQAIRRAGSAALDLAYVAAGRFDGFWELRLMPWDTAAGWLLVTEAGGTVKNRSTDCRSGSRPTGVEK